MSLTQLLLFKIGWMANGRRIIPQTKTPATGQSAHGM